MRKLSFCFGSSRQAATWHPALMDVGELLIKLETPIRTTETTAQYHRMTKAEKEVIKEAAEVKKEAPKKEYVKNEAAVKEQAKNLEKKPGHLRLRQAERRLL